MARDELPGPGSQRAVRAHHHTYRPEIDGLRTVAVVPVVLFHAGVSVFSGGYVGVDIFFVISGFLITRILLASLESGFDLWDFYQRRIRRILPALLVVLLIATIAGIIILTPSALAEYGKSMVGVSLFGSNFFFWKSVDYFSSQAHVQPLLHTWSLAVEEQYYIFYPLLLYAVHRWRLPLVPILAVLGAVSFLAAAILVSSTPGAVFYLLPFRAWELTLGGLVAVVPALAGRSLAARLAAPVGLAMIVLPFFLYTPQTTFPGLAAAPPVVGTALIIWAGERPGSWSYRILASRPFVAIGQASYSFYLWHFPLFAYASYLLNRPLDAATGCMLALVALVAAFASLRWIETPVRRSKSVASVYGPLALLVGALGVGGAVAASGGWPQRLPEEARVLANAPSDKLRHPYHCMSVNQTIVAPEQACRIGAPEAQPRVLLWGDSHAMVTATAMATAARQSDSAFLFAASADCPPGIGFGISDRFQSGLTSAPSYRFCREYNRRMHDLATADPQIRTVVAEAAQIPGVQLIEPHEALCPRGACPIADTTGSPTYFDHNHLSVRAARELSPLFTQVFAPQSDPGA